jgi:hypothetical protein
MEVSDAELLRLRPVGLEYIVVRGGSIEMKLESREALLLSWNAGLLLVGGMILSATVEDSLLSSLRRRVDVR